MSLNLINPFMKFASGGGGIPYYQELGRTTLASPATTFSVSSFDQKPLLLLMISGETDQTNADHSWRFNSDSSSNYNIRYRFNGGSSGCDTSVDQIRPLGTTANQPFFDIAYIANYSDEEKLVTGFGNQYTGTAGGTRNNYFGKWANSSAAITTVTAVNVQTSGSRQYLAGSEIVVLGLDPDDTSGTAAWEELANVTLTSGGDTLDSGTFTSKKYLYIEFTCIPDGNITTQMRFNTDSGTNYGFRESINGAADTTADGEDMFDLGRANADSLVAGSLMVTNISAEYKLIDNLNIIRGESAGSGTAPAKRQGTGYWKNNSSQINQVTITENQAGNFDVGSNLTVWGFD
jgi:hypothetical protein